MPLRLPHLPQSHQPPQQQHPNHKIRVYIPPLPKLHKPPRHHIHEFRGEAQQSHREVSDGRRERLDGDDEHEDVADGHGHADEDVAGHYEEAAE